MVPTHNRAASLQRTLASLAKQTYGADRFEALVIANGCSDDTAATVRTLDMPFALQLVELATSSADLARNTGASMARGDLLLFVDDDVEPPPGFIEAHARAHKPAEDLIAMGPYLPPPLAQPPSLLTEHLWRSCVTFPERLDEWKGPLGWTFLLAGNFSISKVLFERVGGFDNSISRYEDFEFGCRAQKIGARFVFLPQAGAYHHFHENRSLAQCLRIARAEGRSAVAITRRHPETGDRLAIGRTLHARTMLGRLGRWLAFDYPQVGDMAVRVLSFAGSTLGGLRMRRPWNRLVDCIHDYWYFRGIADELGNSEAAARYLEQLGKRVTSDGA